MPTCKFIAPSAWQNGRDKLSERELSTLVQLIQANNNQGLADEIATHEPSPEVAAQLVHVVGASTSLIPDLSTGTKSEVLVHSGKAGKGKKGKSTAERVDHPNNQLRRYMILLASEGATMMHGAVELSWLELRAPSPVRPASRRKGSDWLAPTGLRRV